MQAWIEDLECVRIADDVWGLCGRRRYLLRGHRCSDFRESLVDHCRATASRGYFLVELKECPPYASVLFSLHRAR
jgi:hypothetical protein